MWKYEKIILKKHIRPVALLSNSENRVCYENDGKTESELRPVLHFPGKATRSGVPGWALLIVDVSFIWRLLT